MTKCDTKEAATWTNGEDNNDESADDADKVPIASVLDTCSYPCDAKVHKLLDSPDMLWRHRS